MFQHYLLSSLLLICTYNLKAQSLSLADSLFKARQYDLALKVYEQIPLSSLSDRERQLVIIGKSKCYFHSRQYTTIINMLKSSTKYIAEDTIGYEMSITLGRAYLLNGRLDSAKWYVENALRLHKKVAPLSMSVFDAAKSVYTASNDYDNAFKVSFEGLKIAEQQQNKRIQSIFYQHIGDMYWLRKEHRKAINIYLESLSKVNKDVPLQQVRSTYFGLANCYLSEKQIDSATYFFQKNYESVKTENDPWGIAAALSAYGYMYETTQNYTKAISFYMESLPYYQKSNQHSGMVQAYNNLANSYSHIGAYHEGLKYAQKAAVMADSLKNHGLMKTCYSTLSYLYTKTGEYQKAFDIHKKYSAISDSIFTSEKMRITEETAAKFETYQKDQAINTQKVSLLEKQKTIIQIVSGGIVAILSLLVGFLLYRRQQQKHIKQLETTFEQVTEQLQSFNYSVSHDLQNPLIVAQNALQQLKSDDLKTSQKIAFQQAEKSITTMQQIIHAMLSLSDVERSSINLKEVNTKDLVLDIMSELPNTPSVELGNLPTVKADIALLRQVFINLIDNAIKYSAKSTNPIIKIDADSTTEQVIFNVTDNGVGFPSDYANKLFQPFGRFHPEFVGVGLGLMIVKKIVEKHGGKVSAAGKVGKGATFSFSLPNIIN